jgi:ribonuclease P protein component
MYPKENRLLNKKDFDRVWRAKKSFFLTKIGVKSVKNNKGITRFGIVVGTKISKKAVDRNKVKRLIKQNISDNLSKLKKGYDVVVLCSPKIIKANKKEIEYELKKIFNKLNLYL